MQKIENMNAPTYEDFVDLPQVKMILDGIFHNMHHIHNICRWQSFQPPKIWWKDSLRNLVIAIISPLWRDAKKFEKLNNYDGKFWANFNQTCDDSLAPTFPHFFKI